MTTEPKPRIFQCTTRKEVIEAMLFVAKEKILSWGTDRTKTVLDVSALSKADQQDFSRRSVFQEGSPLSLRLSL